jgi:hypothetical protein
VWRLPVDVLDEDTHRAASRVAPYVGGQACRVTEELIGKAFAESALTSQTGDSARGRVAIQQYHGLWRSLVSALDWGSRGPGFKSRQPDSKVQVSCEVSGLFARPVILSPRFARATKRLTKESDRSRVVGSRRSRDPARARSIALATDRRSPGYKCAYVRRKIAGSCPSDAAAAETGTPR